MRLEERARRHQGEASRTRPATLAPPSPRLRLAAFSSYDFADSAFATSIVTVLFNQYYAGTVAGGASGSWILGRAVPGGTLFAWWVSLAMTLVAVTAPFLGTLADRRYSRIRALAAFLVPGVLLTLLLSTVDAGEWLSGGLLFAAAYACFAFASIFYNALLPELGPPESLGRASGFAWGIGYVGGALLLVLNLIMLRSPRLLGQSAGAFDLKDCFISAGLWWGLFSLPLLWTFRYEDRNRNRAASGRLSAGGEFRAVWRQVGETLRRLARLPNLRRYFVAYLLYNDGVQVVVTMASIFGAQVLSMRPEELIGFFLLIQGTAFVGSIVLGRLADRWSHRAVLLICVVAWTGATLWAAGVGIFGAPVREYWILGGVSGLFLGGIQSCSRSLLAYWIPEGRESELFGFFSIMTRVASIFGPLLYGALNLITGSLRGATLSVTVFFVAGGLMLLRVRPEEIADERRQLASAPSGRN